MVGIGHSEPGKTTPHLISSADILYIVVSYRVHHGRKWVSKLSHILSKETLQFVSLTHLTQRGDGGRRSPPNLLAWLRKVCSTVESRALLLDTEGIMRNIVVSEFVSLDNVIQAPGGAEEDTEGGFTHGGWTGPFWHDDMCVHFFEAMSQSDALLLGRKTWQIHGGAFEPMPAGDPFGDVMNTMPKYVVSTTLTTASAWRNSTLISSNVVEEVRTLKAQPGKNIVIDGSSVLVHTLAEHDLIDEYSLWVYPVVLGSGKKLFPEGLRVNLRLIESRPFPSGVVLMRYARA